MALHKTVLAHRREAIVFNSISGASQFTYMLGMAVELAKRQTLGSNVDIYFLTDNSRKDLIESFKGLKFLSLGEHDEVQINLSDVMNGPARAPVRSPTAILSISQGFWKDPEIPMRNIMRCYEILKEIRPMLVILDQFSRALDAALTLRIPYLMCGNETTPTSRPTSPAGLRAVLTVPSVCSGFVGELSWRQTFINAWMLTVYIAYIFTDPNIRAQAARRRKALDPNLPYATLDRALGGDLEHGEIFAMPRSILHPTARYDTVFPVGPTFVPLFHEKTFVTNLQGWLDENPLVYINLGTLFQFRDADLHVFASTLLDLTSKSASRAASLVTRDTHRFLWKLPTKPQKRLLELYPTFLDDTNGRVRLESWIDSPDAVLAHRNTLLMIHHGGANSFAEAGWFAIPQICLPQWADTYDTGAQIKHLGMGLVNENDAPNLTTTDFADLINGILAAPVDGTGSKVARPYSFYKDNCEKFAEECREAGGATKAAEIIESVYTREKEAWLQEKQ